MLSHRRGVRVARLIAGLGGLWPIGAAPGALALLAQRAAAPLANLPAGLAHVALRAHALLFIASWATLFAVGLRSHAYAR